VEVKSDFGWLLLRLAEFKRRIALGLVCLSLAGGAVTIDPLLMRSLIDSALLERNQRWALDLVGGIGFYYFGRAALHGTGSLINFSTSLDCVRKLRMALGAIKRANIAEVAGLLFHSEEMVRRPRPIR
jgi:ABC-type multidrug transport system fused ATPase/permease subunit